VATSGGGPTDEAGRLQRERDLYLRLLDLGRAEDVRAYVADCLSLLATTTGAQQGYLELYGAEGAAPLVSVSTGLSEAEVEGVRARLSQGIIRDAIRTGTTVSTASAVEDARYASNASVQAARIRAVLCAPLTLPARGGDLGTLGVIYLEGRSAPGPFPKADQALLETAARHVAPYASRLLAEAERGAKTDHTKEIRDKLAVTSVAGRSKALADVLRQVLVAAPVPVTVLLRGESGTGKTALAKALHDASPRKAGPFVDLNVAALPDTLFESELFGAEKGAHSTAMQRTIGKIEAANKGTLFLDEIGELSPAAQAKLLTFLQSKTFLRLGGTAPVEANVRVIAATNADLEDAVRQKRFREDLYYRLNVLEIVVPPLRDRREDVAPIAEALAARQGDDPSHRLPLSRASLRALEVADWPGNVRQLENTIARGWARALSEQAAAIEPHHLFQDRAPSCQQNDETVSFQEATRRFQGRLIEDTLTSADWNVSEAARRLDLSRSHLNDLIRAYGLVRRRPGSA
jgi:Nif-specific regulatory protein